MDLENIMHRHTMATYHMILIVEKCLEQAKSTETKEEQWFLEAGQGDGVWAWRMSAKTSRDSLRDNDNVLKLVVVCRDGHTIL